MLNNAKFDNVSLAGSTFNNISMREVTFTDVAFHGTTFQDVNLSGVTISDANIAGLVINGVNIEQLIQALFEVDCSWGVKGSVFGWVEGDLGAGAHGGRVLRCWLFHGLTSDSVCQR